MRRLFTALLLGLTLMPGAALAERVIAHVSIAAQEMKVYHEGRLLYTWPVSTAKAGKITPAGTYEPEFLSRNHRLIHYDTRRCLGRCSTTAIPRSTARMR